MNNDGILSIFTLCFTIFLQMVKWQITLHLVFNTTGIGYYRLNSFF